MRLRSEAVRWRSRGTFAQTQSPPGLDQLDGQQKGQATWASTAQYKCRDRARRCRGRERLRTRQTWIRRRVINHDRATQRERPQGCPSTRKLSEVWPSVHLIRNRSLWRAMAPSALVSDNDALRGAVPRVEYSGLAQFVHALCCRRPEDCKQTCKQDGAEDEREPELTPGGDRSSHEPSPSRRQLLPRQLTYSSGMAPIELPTAKVSGKDSLLLGLMMGGSIFTLMISLTRAFHFGLHLSTAALVALVAGVVLMVLPTPTRVATLYPEEKAMVIASRTFNFWRRNRRIDLSECTWVRAKGNRGKAVPWVQVQVGTPGYKIVSLVALPGSGSEEVDTAIAWCGRIAEALQIENKGYREIW